MTEEQPSAATAQLAQQDQLRAPYRYSQEEFPVPEGAAVTEFERTPAGYLEIEAQYKETQRALALDFDQYAGTMSREELEEAAREQVDNINAGREEHGAEPIELAQIHENILRRLAEVGVRTDGQMSDRRLKHLIRPVWQDYVPQDDSEESLKTWEDLKTQFPEPMQINLEEFRELDGKMRVLSTDENLRTEIQELSAERLEVMRVAAAYMGADRKVDAISRRIADVYKAAGASNRILTAAEKRHVANLQTRQIEIKDARGEGITSPNLKQQVGAELRTRMNIERRRQFERGLVQTDQMKAIVDELLPSLVQGRPALFVGDTGGAKTALAEHISRHYFGAEPEFISGYGDINSYQVMGKMGLKNEEGATVDHFVAGPIVRAMEAGVPLILDEINAMPPEFLKRLNKIIQLSPGDVFTVQEDSGREVTIQPGFVIMATANEKSKRYKGVEDLSVEFQNRFGANIVRVSYPDNNVVYGQPPLENAIIARAALTDRSGTMVDDIPANELEQFIRACHVTQQVFSGNYGQGFDDYRSPESRADGRPGLDEAVLAPRTMVALLEKVRYSHGKVTLNQAVERFVAGVKGDHDKKQLTTILQGYGFMRRASND